MDQTQQLDLYKSLLLTWGAKVNLIGPEARGNLDEHIQEGVFAAELVTPTGRVLDFGSGGGLPGIPMAIVSPEARFELVEGDQRKWAFLKHVIRECGLNSLAHGDRLARFVEKLGENDRFDMITSRAVGRPDEWLPVILPHLIVGGRVVLFAGAGEKVTQPDLVLEQSHELPRRKENILFVFRKFHVEHDG